MKRSGGGARRRPAVHITLARAARLHRLVVILSRGPKSREDLLSDLGIGLRTFYRELELLKKCSVKVRLEARLYVLKTSAMEAEGRLPFPDPQLSFAEMEELARGTGDAAKRLAAMLAQVVGTGEPKGRKKKAPKE